MDKAPGADAPAIPSRLTGGLPNRTEVTALTDEMKAFVVRGLARYQSPSEVAEGLRDAFGIEVSRQLVHRYDPDSARPPAQRWRDLHAAARQAFLDEAAVIGVAHKAVRLRLLDRMTQRALADNYTIKAAAFLEQAAKECGGIYESRKPVVPPKDSAS
jgi:hypothetical protein